MFDPLPVAHASGIIKIMNLPIVSSTVVKFRNCKIKFIKVHEIIKFVKVHTGQSIQVFIGRRPVDVGIAMPDRFNVVNET